MEYQIEGWEHCFAEHALHLLLGGSSTGAKGDGVVTSKDGLDSFHAR